MRALTACAPVLLAAACAGTENISWSGPSDNNDYGSGNSTSPANPGPGSGNNDVGSGNNDVGF
eukprot:COSAG05_NODE_7649_length_784_cov_1.534307_1_plen_62_part_01